MSAIQSCDPAARGVPYNTLFLLVHNDVSIEVRWNWDGTSVWPACDGPLINGGTGSDRWAVRATNNGAVPYYAHSINRLGTPKTYTLNPGQTVSLTAAQMSSNGYTVISDFYDLTLTPTP